MTRETKVGLVVAGSFICLVTVVVATKFRGETTPPSSEIADAAQSKAEPKDKPGKHKDSGKPGQNRTMVRAPPAMKPATHQETKPGTPAVPPPLTASGDSALPLSLPPGPAPRVSHDPDQEKLLPVIRQQVALANRSPTAGSNRRRCRQAPRRPDW